MSMSFTTSSKQKDCQGRRGLWLSTALLLGLMGEPVQAQAVPSAVARSPADDTTVSPWTTLYHRLTIVSSPLPGTPDPALAARASAEASGSAMLDLYRHTVVRDRSTPAHFNPVAATAATPSQVTFANTFSSEFSTPEPTVPASAARLPLNDAVVDGARQGLDGAPGASPAPAFGFNQVADNPEGSRLIDALLAAGVQISEEDQADLEAATPETLGEIINRVVTEAVIADPDAASDIVRGVVMAAPEQAATVAAAATRAAPEQAAAVTTAAVESSPEAAAEVTRAVSIEAPDAVAEIAAAAATASPEREAEVRAAAQEAAPDQADAIETAVGTALLEAGEEVEVEVEDEPFEEVDPEDDDDGAPLEVADPVSPS